MVQAANRDGRGTCTNIYNAPSHNTDHNAETCDPNAYEQVLAETLQRCHSQNQGDESPAAEACTVDGAMEIRWSAPHPQAGHHVFKSLEDMAQIWLHHGGDAVDLPTVNFNQSMVLATFSGEGCFRESISICRLKQTADLIQAYVCAYTRPWSIRNAMSVIQVPRAELPVQFVQLL